MISNQEDPFSAVVGRNLFFSVGRYTEKETLFLLTAHMLNVWPNLSSFSKVRVILKEAEESGLHCRKLWSLFHECLWAVSFPLVKVTSHPLDDFSLPKANTHHFIANCKQYFSRVEAQL